MTAFTRGQAVLFPHPADGRMTRGTYRSRVPGEDGPAARARVEDLTGETWKVPLAQVTAAPRIQISPVSLASAGRPSGRVTCISAPVAIPTEAGLSGPSPGRGLEAT